ncbi:MAG TPA: imidazolonepropionase [Caulobacteraceae bacterium]|nr:imidazolonepropionase [Caulobacteraceae bacterium]
MRCETVWRNARLATLAGAGFGEVDDGLIACADGLIAFAGPAAEAPSLEAQITVDCEGRWITPALIDCHTHLVFAGERAGEFEQRLAGASYEAIARAGGGILSTVKATRAASEAELVEAALPRIDEMIADGVGTVEVKSGYGLTLADELKQLRVARALGGRRPVRIAPTFLGAHALPPEYRDDRAGYVQAVLHKMIPAVAASGLAEAVDVFCEGIGFSAEESARVFAAARAHGLKVKAHAEQLSNLGGAALAASFGAVSADHLEYLDLAGAKAMARSGTVAVLLPGAFYFTRETRRPPVDILRALAIPMALATDCNPGTSPMTSPLLAMNMGATLFGLTAEECLAGFTRNAAKALGLQAEVGTLEAGKRCDLAIWEIERPAELVYWIGRNPLHARVWGGR